MKYLDDMAFIVGGLIFTAGMGEQFGWPFAGMAGGVLLMMLGILLATKDR